MEFSQEPIRIHDSSRVLSQLSSIIFNKFRRPIFLLLRYLRNLIPSNFKFQSKYLTFMPTKLCYNFSKPSATSVNFPAIVFFGFSSSLSTTICSSSTLPPCDQFFITKHTSGILSSFFMGKGKSLALDFFSSFFPMVKRAKHLVLILTLTIILILINVFAI